MWRRIALAAVFVCLLAPLASAVDGEAAQYIGGTLPGLSEGQTGRLDTSSRDLFRFLGEKGKWESPYKNITRLEYGRKPGRQIAAAIIISPFWLAAPKRKHFLTITVKDENGNSQVGVFELSKDRYVTTIADLEERSGVKVEVEAAGKKDAK